MTKQEAIRILDEVIPPPEHHTVDLDHLPIAQAWLCIKETLTAEPVKHGRWIWNKRLGEWYCSNCDRIMTPYTVEKSEGEYEMAQPFYCGWCGARMDGEENGI